MSSKNVNELDYVPIKANIIAFLEGQSEFADYNFAGSGMNVLIDLLTYATHYMGVYGNMTFNEMFLQTTLLRASTVSKAAELGYMPNQMTAATATIRLSTPSAVDIDVDIGTDPVIFTGTNEFGKTFTFQPTSDFKMISDTVTATIDLPIYEGIFTTDQWTYTAGSDARYIIGNEFTDTKFLTVFIRENASSSNYVEWLQAGTVVNISGADEVFFIRETKEKRIDIYFGNDVIGKSLIDLNIILARYFVTAGPEANNINVFNLSAGFNAIPVGSFTIETVYSSRGGSDKESIEKIKHNAPLFYQTQNRAVTENDYTSLLLSNFDTIQAINVWGGEKNDPPYYGRSMISIKPTGADYLTPSQKTEMLTYLENVQITGIIPVIVDPDYLFIDVKSYVKFNAHLTTLTNADIALMVSDTIDQHFEDNLYAFQATLKYSELITDIDLTDESIFSNYVEFRFRDDLLATTSTNQTYTIRFNNPIKKSTVILEWTNSAFDTMKIIDDSLGSLIKYKNGVQALTAVGTVDYDTGLMTIPNFDFGLSSNETVPVYADPDTYDIETANQNILLKGEVDVDVTRVIV